jgi:hypothetical protein
MCYFVRAPARYADSVPHWLLSGASPRATPGKPGQGGKNAVNNYRLLVIGTILLGWFNSLATGAQPQGTSSEAPSFKVFDAPGAGTEAGQGTTPWSINGNGDIAGSFVDAAGVPHGFLRSKTGSFISFDAPNASERTGQGTIARSVNDQDDVAGYFYAATGVRRGFVRRKDGSFAVFDPLGSAGTVLNAINAPGDVAGNYVINDQAHGLLGHRDGKFISFDPPGGFNTAPEWITDSGEIAGYYEDQLGVLHGFIRHKDGTFATIDVPDAIGGEGKGTFPMSLNENGELVGHYSAGGNGLDRGFVRHKDGSVASVDPPGGITDDAAHADAEGYVLRAVTAPLSVNERGEATGYFDDTSGFVHGFVSHADGAFTTFEVPGATPGSGLGTFPASINNAGEVTGYFYTGTIGVQHGFVMSPASTHAHAPRK